VIGDPDAAEHHAASAVALARELGNEPALAAALRELGEVMTVRNDYAAAFSLYEESLVVARAAGESTVPTLTNLADVALAAGELERAIDYSVQAAELASGQDAEIVCAIGAYNSASALIQLGRGGEAPPHLRSALETVVRIEYPELIGWYLAASSALAATIDPPDAAHLLGAVEAAVESAGAALGPAEQRLRSWTITVLEKELALPELERELQSGRALELEEAVSLARQYLD